MNEHNIDSLIHLFFETNNLEKLVNEAAEVLKNPIVLCNTSYHFIAHSQADNVSDQSWRRGMKCERWSYRFISIINNCDLDYSGQTHTTQIFTSINEDSSKRRKIGTLCNEGIHLGYYLILEEFTPFDDIPEEIYQQVEVILSKCLLLDPSLYLGNKRDLPESLILDLLQNRFENESVYQERIKKSDLPRSGNFILFCMDLNNYRNKDINVNADKDRIVDDIRSDIGRCLPLSWQIIFKEKIVVLANIHSNTSNIDSELDQFRSYLDKTHQCAGCSSLFFDSFQLYRFFEQAVAALELGRAFEDTRMLVPYEDYKIYDLFRHSTTTDLFTQFGTDVIQAISQYDMQNSTEYLETVESYIGNRCSVHKTAKAMYVHRNTIVYRISRVKELFGLTFENDYDNYMNYTACLLQKYCKHYKPTNPADS